MSKATGMSKSTQALDVQVKKLHRSWETACQAIEIIHDQQLYKLRGHATFKDFVRNGLDLTRGRAYQMLAAAATLKRLPEDTRKMLSSERAVAELKKVEPDEREDLITELSLDSPATKVTAKAIVEKVAERKEIRQRVKTGAPKQKRPTKIKTYDKNNKLIKQEAVADAFRKSKDITGMIARLRKLDVELEELCADKVIGVHIPASGLRTYIHNVTIALRHGLPYIVCPKCKGEAKGCTGCRRSGWITKTMAKRMKE